MKTSAPTPAAPNVAGKAGNLGARVRGSRPRRTSLFAHGEPMVWLTGGALALAVFMVAGLLLLVFVQGVSTFWPGEIQRLDTSDGSAFLGELSRAEEYVPAEVELESLPPPVLESARDRLSETGGSSRRLLRTGNFDLTGTHYHWVSDYLVESESRPEWALVIERMTWGRFYGLPQAFVLDGERTAEGDAEAVWKLFNAHHSTVRERWEQRRRLEKIHIGRLNLRMENARLEVRKAEMDHGPDSKQVRRAVEAQGDVNRDAGREFSAISANIRVLNEENDRYRMVVRTADGREQTIGLADIVRAFPPNRLGLFGKVGIYLSRWWEYLTDDPREANSEGGVWPAIFGTILLTLIMCIVVVPFGVLAALYLREYARPGPLTSGVRIAINNLAGVPSIVFGVFGLGFFCYLIGSTIDDLFYSATLPNPTYGKSGLMWASLTLALLTLPVVIVATEEALQAVPSSMREGSYACGASKAQTLWRIVLPRAMPGIMTGMILAIARGAGEVAPLMLVGAVKLAPALPLDLTFVDLGGSFGPIPLGPLHPDRSFMHLGFHIFDLGFQSQNSEAAKPMVYTTTMLLIGIVVMLNVFSIWIRGRLRRKFGSGHF